MSRRMPRPRRQDHTFDPESARATAVYITHRGVFLGQIQADYAEDVYKNVRVPVSIGHMVSYLNFRRRHDSTSAIGFYEEVARPEPPT